MENSLRWLRLIDAAGEAGRFLVDFLEKNQPLLMTALALDATDQLSKK